MKLSISVIIPTYNRAMLVQQAVESVLQQRGEFRFEIIVVDDGSTPDTEQGLRRFHNSIRYVRQENAGLNPARNHGLRLASGDYVALLDDDDVWLPFKTALLMQALQRFPQAGFAHSNFIIWKPNGDLRRRDGLRSWFPRPFAWDEIYEQQDDLSIADPATLGLPLATFKAYYGDLYYWSLFSPMVLPSTAIIRRSAIGTDFRFPEVDSVGDWEFFARLSKRCGGVFVAEETTLNRSHEDAVRLTRTDPSLRLQRRIALIQRLWRQDQAFMRNEKALVDQVEAECLRRLAKLFISAGKGAAARDALRSLRGIVGRRAVHDSLLWGLACAPFAHAAVGLMRSLRARTRSAKTG
jgi:glycosyltransferase involved in cell wall biosynthesis